MKEGYRDEDEDIKHPAITCARLKIGNTADNYKEQQRQLVDRTISDLGVITQQFLNFYNKNK